MNSSNLLPFKPGTWYRCRNSRMAYCLRIDSVGDFRFVGLGSDDAVCFWTRPRSTEPQTEGPEWTPTTEVQASFIAMPAATSPHPLTFVRGKHYKTANGSTVKCLSPSVFEVVTGGHGNGRMDGYRAGDSYVVDDDGVYRNSRGDTQLLGMNVVAECEVPPVPKLVKGQTYTTRNGSLLHCTRAEPDCDGEAHFEVIRGGHGVPDQPGREAGNSVYLALNGTALESPKRYTAPWTAFPNVVAALRGLEFDLADQP